MGGAIAKIIFKTGNDEFDTKKYESLLDIPVTTIKGEKMKFLELTGNKYLYLIVNVASK